MSHVVGIDLGTTNSAIAVVNKYGKPEIIANREGERTTPSVVLFDGHDPLVGSIAKRSAVATPLNVVQFVKRQMGENTWKFHAETGESFTPEEISALIIKRLKEDAENLLGEEVTDAVITVPAYFDDAQRKATQDAGRIAGLNVLRIINEPTAAALAYGMDKLNESANLLVYDLGGGTFDVTILRLDRGNIRVLATGGAKNLGGFDWDNEVMFYLNSEFKKQGGPDLLEDPIWEQDLRDKAEIAKKTLSSRDRTNVFLSAGGVNASIPFTREKFEEITSYLLKQTEHTMRMVLEDAGLTWDDIDKTILVGGSTRMAAVPALVERVSGKKPAMDVHPDEVVAMGAAIQGMLIKMQEGETHLENPDDFPLVEVHDVTSHSMGTVAVDEENGHRLYNAIVVKKGTPIPCKVRKRFRTVVDNQTHVHVQITEGEDEDLEYVKIVGEAVMEIPPYPKGALIEDIYEYDSNGIIHVSVYDLTAGKLLGKMEIKRTSNLTEDEVEEKRIRIGRIPVN